MTAFARETFPAIPDDAVRHQAELASRALAHLGGRGAVRVEAISEGEPAQPFVLPAPAVRLLTDMMALLAQGRAVTVFPQDADLTTQQAADLLNVSRPYLVKLIESGAIAFHKVGTHRRIRLDDLLAYRLASEAQQRDAVAALAEEGQRLGLGY
jgi:excisionase family DNA binding protein